MREYKFRGKRVDNGEWVEGDYFKTPLTDEATNSKPKDGWFFLAGRPRHCISKNNCVYEVIPETVGQFTGMFDKNNKDIYEGDIITSEEYPFQCDGKYNYHGVIEWDDCQFQITYNLVNSSKSGDLDGSVEFLVSYIPSNLEIIGNIHDNYDLLEVQE